MKKIYLFVLALSSCFIFTSCDEDSSEAANRPSGEMTLVVDGYPKSYNNVHVDETELGDGSVMLTITGSQNGDPTEYITFRVKKYNTGLNRATRWRYSDDSNFAKRETVNGVVYDVTSQITLNSNNRLRGTFSGKLYNTYSRRVVKIQDGAFAYNYNLPQP